MLLLVKVTIVALGEGFIYPGYHPFTQFIWNDLDKYRTGRRTAPIVGSTGPIGKVRRKPFTANAMPLKVF